MRRAPTGPSEAATDEVEDEPLPPPPNYPAPFPQLRSDEDEPDAAEEEETVDEEPETPETPAVETSSGCGCRAAGPSAGGAAALAGLWLLAFVRRRRR